MVNSVLSCVVNTRHTPARTPRFHRAFDPRIDLTHRYQNKGFINYLFSHTCALLRPYPLCFDMLHKNTRGEGDTSWPTVPSPIGTHGRSGREQAEAFLALLGMTTRSAARPAAPSGAHTTRLRRWPLQEQGAMQERVTRSAGSGRRGCAAWAGARWIAAGACGERGDRAARRGHGRRRCAGWDP